MLESLKDWLGEKYAAFLYTPWSELLHHPIDSLRTKPDSSSLDAKVEAAEPKSNGSNGGETTTLSEISDPNLSTTLGRLKTSKPKPEYIAGYLLYFNPSPNGGEPCVYGYVSKGTFDAHQELPGKRTPIKTSHGQVLAPVSKKNIVRNLDGGVFDMLEQYQGARLDDAILATLGPYISAWEKVKVAPTRISSAQSSQPPAYSLK